MKVLSNMEEYKIATTVKTENISGEMGVSDYLVGLSGQSTSYCVGIVDIVNSTSISTRLSMERFSRYYQIFLNFMSKTVSRFGGTIVKNAGDSLLYYFPESSKSKRKYGFMSCIECSLTMIETYEILYGLMEKEGLPSVDYRVSADYGGVMLMMIPEQFQMDIIGPPVNMATKINLLAQKNAAVIGGDLYEMVRDFNEYEFHRVKDYSVGLKYSYPVYSVGRKN
jgi:adenylate cyclase